MKLRHAHGIAIAGLALAAALGCQKGSKDTSKVIANVGGEKITEKAFGETIKAMLPEEAKAKEILTSEAMRDKRNEFLSQLAKAKALVLLGKAQGLDKDPGVQVRMEQMTAQAYVQAMVERRLAKIQPTEADLKATYDELVAERKAQGQDKGIPPFEQVKAQMPMLYKQRQEAKVFEQLMKEATQKSPITYADAYKPSQIQP
jgi:peptidyl-prolyl cis-trans isomerase C